MKLFARLALIFWAVLQMTNPILGLEGEDSSALKVQVITVETEAELLQILDLLKAGSKFSDLAREHSTHPTAESGGFWQPPSGEELANELRQRFSKAGKGSILYFRHPLLGYTIVRQEIRSTEKDRQLEAALRKGGKYLRESQPSRAIEAFREAVSLEPLSAEAHMLLGYAYRLAGNHNFIAEAKAEFRQALMIDPSLLWARFYLAKMYIDLGRLSSAKEQLETALQWHAENPEAKALLGEVERQLGHPELSAKYNAEVLEQTPSHTAASYYLGLAYLDMGEENEALEQFEKAASLEGASAEVYVSLGSLLLDRDDIGNALKSFEKAIDLRPSNSRAHLGMAAAYRRLGRLDKALEELERTLPPDGQVAFSPYYQRIRADLHFERGLILRQEGRTAEAIQAFSETLRLLATHGEAHRSLAELLFEQENYRLAEEHALKAEELGTPVEESFREKISQKLEEGS